jgi:hypothetical protein
MVTVPGTRVGSIDLGDTSGGVRPRADSRPVCATAPFCGVLGSGRHEATEAVSTPGLVLLCFSFAQLCSRVFQGLLGIEWIAY